MRIIFAPLKQTSNSLSKLSARKELIPVGLAENSMRYPGIAKQTVRMIPQSHEPVIFFAHV